MATDDLLPYFRIEAGELLETLASGVLELERSAGDPALVARLLRAAHTLKGSARVVKQAAVADAAHAMEDILARCREAPTSIPSQDIAELLRLVDGLAASVGELQPAPAGASRPAPEGAPGRPIAAPSPRGAPPAVLSFETLRVAVREVDALLDSVTEAGVQLTALRQQVGGLAETRRLAAAVAHQAQTLADVAGAERLQAQAEQLRAATRVIERRILPLVERAEREVADAVARGSRLRLIPVSATFASLERAARDAAAALGRRVEWATEGGEQRLDAHVLGPLQDALLHGVRNAVAHGIEGEAERRAAGKPATGRVTLSVERRGRRVAVRCSDDGRGLDVDAIRRVAVRRGLVPPAAAEAMGLEDAIRIVLAGGVSTSAVVDGLSGRGVGMDVLRDAARRLDGDLEIRSEAGRGTTVELRVPLSLASLPALLVEVADGVVALPMDALRSVLRVRAGDLVPAAGGTFVRVGDALVPFLPLADALGRDRRAASPPKGGVIAVVLDAGGLAAVGVHRLVGAAQVVVRPLPALAPVSSTVAGAALDAEGHPRLVVDPRGLVAAVRAARGAAPGPAPARPRVLVVDDSLTSRALQQSILEAAGYDVELAASGEEAWVKAQDRPYALFVVDVEMPGMDGFAFIERLRADPGLRARPAIFVTTRASPEDRARGAAAGAQAWFAKSEFDQDAFLDKVRSLAG